MPIVFIGGPVLFCSLFRGRKWQFIQLEKWVFTESYTWSLLRFIKWKSSFLLFSLAVSCSCFQL